MDGYFWETLQTIESDGKRRIWNTDDDDNGEVQNILKMLARVLDLSNRKNWWALYRENWSLRLSKDYLLVRSMAPGWLDTCMELIYVDLVLKL